MSRNVRWAIFMTVLGVSAGLVAWWVTDSLWWGLGGLLGSGIVFNMLFRPGTPARRSTG